MGIPARRRTTSARYRRQAELVLLAATAAADKEKEKAPVFVANDDAVAATAAIDRTGYRAAGQVSGGRRERSGEETRKRKGGSAMGSATATAGPSCSHY